MDSKYLLNHFFTIGYLELLLSGDGGFILAGEGLQKLLLLGGDALLAPLAGLLHLVTTGLGLVAIQKIVH